MTHSVLIVCACALSSVWLSAVSWTLDCQTPLPMEFSRQEYLSRLPFPTPGNLPDLWIESLSLVSPAFVEFLTTAPSGQSWTWTIDVIKIQNNAHFSPHTDQWKSMRSASEEDSESLHGGMGSSLLSKVKQPWNLASSEPHCHYQELPCPLMI